MARKDGFVCIFSKWHIMPQSGKKRQKSHRWKFSMCFYGEGLSWLHLRTMTHKGKYKKVWILAITCKIYESLTDVWNSKYAFICSWAIMTSIKPEHLKNHNNENYTG